MSACFNAFKSGKDGTGKETTQHEYGDVSEVRQSYSPGPEAGATLDGELDDGDVLAGDVVVEDL
ncbi:MAG TPA: hypothetical protein V6C72_01125, partial [Chroococcales cyanobacterium]